MKIAIGADFGGTAVKMGVVAESGEILHRAEALVRRDASAEDLMDGLADELRKVLDWTVSQDLSPLGLGLSVSGFVLPPGDRHVYSNVRQLDGYPMKGYLEEKLETPVLLDCDQTCAALGEYHFGAGQGVSRLVVVTLGTSVGVGAILDGQVVRINSGSAGNPGHVIVDPNGVPCSVGCRGCLASIAEAQAISRQAKDMALSMRDTMLTGMLAERGTLTPKDVYQAAEAGDETAQEILQDVGRWLGRGLATWVGFFGPEVVLVGGGLSHAGRWLLEPMEREMRRIGEPYFTAKVREVKRAHLGKDVGMLGAASLYFFPEYALKF